MTYLFKSTRLGFRNWEPSDIDVMSEINGCVEVMKFFPKTQSKIETLSFMKRMMAMLEERRYCYFAVDELNSYKLIGFIGLAYQDYKADFTPCVDIGWRLHKLHWNKGYATEGAQACLNYGFKNLNLNKIYSVATKNNLPSINVMKKIGMSYLEDFEHSKLLDYPDLKLCSLYSIDANTFFALNQLHD